MKSMIYLILCLAIVSCKKEVKDKEENTFAFEEEPETIKTAKERKEELTSKGFEIFDYVDEETKDTVLMQQYFIAFLKRGPNRSQNKEEEDGLQALHMAHLGSMYEQGFADISGPFGDDGDIRGITIYNVPTQKMADSLANSDPMVQAGRLQIEIHPWWAAKGFSLR
nr:YciI family protein [Maribacter sp. Hal144]